MAPFPFSRKRLNMTPKLQVHKRECQHSAASGTISDYQRYSRYTCLLQKIAGLERCQKITSQFTTVTTDNRHNHPSIKSSS